ncbi:Ig-like domain-containing protein [Cellvibrio sp. pealriver]|uniref:Ig-like domain-containing protein n=1 Tax=Cellvibrio sp. pealriver TaxID=1622269 RepID=UPI0018CEF418|nr:Ig-like domain-containing protein [Cellvibrio sp. pealriver]
MFKQHKLRLAVAAITTGVLGSMASLALAQNVKVDINANIKHSVNGVSDFGRERRITIHASPMENDFLGEKDKLDYLMDLDVTFGRDNGLSMYYFSQTGGDKARSTDSPSPFPYGYANKPNLAQLSTLSTEYKQNLDTKYADAQEYFGRTSSLIMGSQPRPAYPNWSSYSWFGGGLTSETPWRPRTAQDAADWYAEFLNKFFVQYENDPTAIPMPKYWEVVNEPDMLMNVPSHEGHLSTWEELFEFHNVVADTVRSKLGNKAPKIGGMTWGLHDLEKGDATATGSPRNRGDALLNLFYGNDAGSEAIKNAIRTNLFNKSPTMSANGPSPSADWYQWDVIWKGFMDAAGENMDFYSVHLYDWASWNGGTTRTGALRTGFQTEGVIDLLEWYDTKMLGQRKEVVMSEYGNITGTDITKLDRQRMRWEVLKPFSQMMMQFMERPDYITLSMPFIVVKGEWGDVDKNNPYGQSLLDRDYSTCTETPTAYTNCTWNFNPSIKWYELWRDVDGTRVDTYASDRDIQVDAYVNGKNMYVILNSLEAQATTVDMNFAGISGNAIKSIKMRHLYLDEAIDDDNNPANGVGKPILADATLNSLPKNITIGADATVILDIEYTNNLNPTLNSKEKKYPAEPLTANAPYRVSAANVNAQVNGVPKPAKGEAQLRVTGAFFMNGGIATGSSDSRVSLKINGNTVPVKTDWRGDESRRSGRSMATLEIPFDVSYLSASGNNNIQLTTIAQGEVAAVSLQVWDMDTQVTRSIPAACSPCTPVTGLSLSQTSVSNLLVTQSVALKPSVSPANASNQNVTWASSNPSVASVDQNGLVTGNKPGSATITAKTVDGALTATASVSVSQLVPAAVSVVGLPNPLYIGASKQLSAAVTPIHAPNRKVTWSSSNTTIATVDAQGVVTGLKAGNVTITAKTVANNIVGTANIQVKAKLLTGMAISPANTLIPQNDSLQIQTSFTPADASDKSVTWTSSNTAVATVSTTGLVKGVGLGVAEITGRSNDGGFSGKTQVEVVASNTTLTYIEAEAFNRTGGAYGGFVKSTTGAGNINDNQTGDWVEFDINFAQAGIYQLVLATGTPLDGAGVEFLVDGISNGRSSLPNNGNWDQHVTTVVTNGLQINSAGTHTLRLISVGAGGAYQWNLDKIGYRILKATTGGASSIAASIPASSSRSSTPLSSSSRSSTPLSSSLPSSAPLSSSSRSSTSVSSSSSVASSVATGGLKLVLEAEAYTATGGVYQGFQKYTPAAGVGAINYNQRGDWADYTLNVTSAGTYSIDAFLGTTQDGGAIEVLIDGVSVAKKTVANNNNWDVFAKLVVASGVQLSAGTHSVRIISAGTTASTWEWNADRIEFTQVAVATPSSSSRASSSAPAAVPVVMQAESYIATGGTYQGFQKYTTAAGVGAINYNQTGDWADYSINVTATANYRINAYLGTTQTGGAIEVLVDGVSVAKKTVPNNNNWDVFALLEVSSSVQLSQGAHTLRIISAGASSSTWEWNADRIEFIPVN